VWCVRAGDPYLPAAIIELPMGRAASCQLEGGRLWPTILRMARAEARPPVYRPKFIFGTESTPEEQRALGEAFFRGVDSHKEGSAVWNKHLDQSR
jgi:hypothetical protein